jgi:hypothetical protein
MKTVVTFFCVLFAANGVFADIYSEAIKQARNVSANETKQSNAEVNQNNSSPPPAAAQPAPPQTNPVLEATLRNISNLHVDFDALGKLSETNSAASKKLLLDDLTAAAQGAKPPEVSISKLADDLTTAVVGKKLPDDQQQKLAQDVHAIFNSSHLSSGQQQMIFTSVQKVLQDGGTLPDETTNVVNDIKTIASQTQ